MSFRTLDLNLLKVEAPNDRRQRDARANALCMTQPAVSNALARLRDSLDDPCSCAPATASFPRAAVLWSELGEALTACAARSTPKPSTPRHDEFSLSMSDYIAGIVPAAVRAVGAVRRRRVRAVPNTLLEIPEQLEENRADCVLSAYVNEAQYPAISARARFGWWNTPVSCATITRWPA